MTINNLARYIDHTLLDATAASRDILRVCREAESFRFHTVCVNPRWLPLAVEQLAGIPVKAGTVVSLPLGADPTEIKTEQARYARDKGAQEVDMVADLAAVIEQDTQYLVDQFNAVAEICHSSNPPIILKIILETAALSTEQKAFACRIADRCGADFVKTSTGMNPAGGATEEDVRLLKKHAPHCKVKAAGGIRTPEQAIKMIDAGASRIGTSSAVRIIEKFRPPKS